MEWIPANSSSDGTPSPEKQSHSLGKPAERCLVLQRSCFHTETHYQLPEEGSSVQALFLHPGWREHSSLLALGSLGWASRALWVSSSTAVSALHGSAPSSGEWSQTLFQYTFNSFKQFNSRGPCSRFIPTISETDSQLSSVWHKYHGHSHSQLYSKVRVRKSLLSVQSWSHIRKQKTNSTKVLFSLKFHILKFFLPALIVITSTVRVQDTRKTGNTELGWHSGQK